MELTPETSYGFFSAKLSDLQKLRADCNEAEVRLKAINEIFFSILGWHHDSVEVEKYCREIGFADYVFSQNGIKSLVVEAKKAGIHFVLPENRIGTEPVPFALIGKECPAAQSALLQAIGYAVTLGARYVAITNGRQWIFTLTFIENQAVEDRLVFVFDSVETINNNFRAFWSCFSATAIAKNAMHEHFFESRMLPPPPKLSTSIPGYPVPSTRNYYVNELTYVLRVLWDKIASEEKTDQFIENCYVETQIDNQLITYASMLLKQRAHDDAKYTERTVEHLNAADHAFLDAGNKPFVILGDVGHGKTTFLSYLRYHAVATQLKGYIQIDLDFVDRPDKPEEIASYIYRAIETQLRLLIGMDILADEVVRGVLYTEFQRFKNSARYKVLEGDTVAQKKEELKFIEEHIADRHNYLGSLFRYLKRGQRKSIVLFFDNLDRRSISIQEEAFLKASAAARDWECAVFVCLRPTTFFESHKRGVFDALAPRTFTVGAPDLSLVLKRRFEFARRLALGELRSDIFDPTLKEAMVAINLPSVAAIFECCEFSSRKGPSAIRMLSALANGNIRLLIELTKTILTSGHLDTRKIVRQIQETNGYIIPDYEAAKTLLFRDYDQYFPNASILINIFDIYHSDPKEHFIRLLLLDYLNRSIPAGDCRVSIEERDIVSFSNTYYFDPNTLRRHLSALESAECIQVERIEHTAPRYRITTRGRYHVSGLIKTFQYLDAILVDTPILDSAIRSKITLVDDIRKRTERTRYFVEYLKQCAKSLCDRQGQGRLEEYFKDAESEITAVQERSSRP